METRMDKRKAQTKEKIFLAAVELFLQQGFDRTTVEQITEKADVAKGTFFNHFPSKIDVLFYLSEQRMTLMEDLLERKLKKIKSAREKIYVWLKVFAEKNEENKDIVMLVVKEAFKLEFSQMKPEKEVRTKFIFKLLDIIKEGQEMLEFRNDFDPYLAADLLMSMYYFTLFQWLEGDLSRTLTEEYLSRAEIILSGIRR
ncbi:MAG: TetR/AcrR family transcriptional regulator [Dehalobacterium sp.]